MVNDDGSLLVVMNYMECVVGFHHSPQMFSELKILILVLPQVTFSLNSNVIPTKIGDLMEHYAY